MIVKLNFHNADGRIVAKGYKYEIKDCHNNKSLKEDLIATMVNSYPVIVKYFEKQGIQIEIDGQHPTGEDCIFNKKNGAWLGYTSMFCNIHECMDCEVCEIH